MKIDWRHWADTGTPERKRWAPGTNAISSRFYPGCLYNTSQESFFFQSCHTACGILVPRPGIKPMPPAVDAWSLNHWTAREVPRNFFFFFNIWLCCVFVAMCGLSLVAASGDYSSLRCAGSSLRGFSCFRARVLGAWASTVVAHRLRSCGAWA